MSNQTKSNRKYNVLLVVFIVTTLLTIHPVWSQSKLTLGAKLLFGNTKSRLTDVQKNAIYKALGFSLSKDGKQFILDDNYEFPFDAFVYPTDLNSDAREEITVIYGNSFTSGHTGSSIAFFLPEVNGSYKEQFGFPGGEPLVLANPASKFPDLVITGPGFEFPVWRWNGNKYVFSRSVKDAQLQKLKTQSLNEVSARYVAGIK